MSSGRCIVIGFEVPKGMEVEEIAVFFAEYFSSEGGKLRSKRYQISQREGIKPPPYCHSNHVLPHWQLDEDNYIWLVVTPNEAEARLICWDRNRYPACGKAVEKFITSYT